ncbi:FGGY family of carbohydrate kinase, N-terminal domain protein [Mycobacterium ulcerans str. Harvey]|uniref:FGGY family of carbohydrate kinase, N-terminal domain protein n=1 Tax=Mycobacterium ulcerans str. Harvey TaxID=1299332 RepID=A0ABP3A4X9_MYCUL|nr:FGGY family of carbohydrate kinase, N-terminal domain protein [Mycobacterium ulcerans str. Harvey]
MIFDHQGAEIARHQLVHEQILPRAGWVEHNPVEIWERTASVLMSVLNATDLSPKNIAALGITNQRETTLVWNKRTGRPYYNAIVWQDTRTDRIASALDRDGRGDVIRRKAGLPRRRISRAASCSGFWRTSTGCAPPPNAVMPSSVPRTPGCCGT